MNNSNALEQTFSDTASAIKTKLHNQAAISPKDFPSKIANIPVISNGIPVDKTQWYFGSNAPSTSDYRYWVKDLNYDGDIFNYIYNYTLSLSLKDNESISIVERGLSLKTIPMNCGITYLYWNNYRIAVGNSDRKVYKYIMHANTEYTEDSGTTVVTTIPVSLDNDDKPYYCIDGDNLYVMYCNYYNTYNTNRKGQNELYKINLSNSTVELLYSYNESSTQNSNAIGLSYIYDESTQTDNWVVYKNDDLNDSKNITATVISKDSSGNYSTNKYVIGSLPASSGSRLFSFGHALYNEVDGNKYLSITINSTGSSVDTVHYVFSINYTDVSNITSQVTSIELVPDSLHTDVTGRYFTYYYDNSLYKLDAVSLVSTKIVGKFNNYIALGLYRLDLDSKYSYYHSGNLAFRGGAISTHLNAGILYRIDNEAPESDLCDITESSDSNVAPVVYTLSTDDTMWIELRLAYLLELNEGCTLMANESQGVIYQGKLYKVYESINNEWSTPTSIGSE